MLNATTLYVHSIRAHNILLSIFIFMYMYSLHKQTFFYTFMDIFIIVKQAERHVKSDEQRTATCFVFKHPLPNE